MKPLLIALFLVANVLSINQTCQRLHQLLVDRQPSVLNQFNPKDRQARAEKPTDVLVAELRAAIEEINSIEKNNKSLEPSRLRRENQELYSKKDAITSEIWRRQNNSQELRDLWSFSGSAIVLILVGTALYRRSNVWVGLGLLVSGFTILLQWAGPVFGRVEDPRLLLVSKTLVAVIALVLLYGFWWLKDPSNRAATGT
jgi:hypothetical protein